MKINEVLKKHSLVPNKYENIGRTSIVDTNSGRYVFKDEKANLDVLYYLRSRNFDYMPNIVNDPLEDNYQLLEHVNDFDIPKEQKILDLIGLTSLLHSKTTHYKEVDINDYEQIYDDINGNLEYLFGYYTDMITLIENKVYMSPSEFLLARNITMIYETLDICKDRLERWHKLIEEKRKQRSVVLHNNLNLDHFIINDNAYLISWDKAKIGNPVFDLYKLYRTHALDFDFSDIFGQYEENYPLMEDERELLFILISMPDIIEFNDTEYNLCKIISNEIDKIYKSNQLPKQLQKTPETANHE